METLQDTYISTCLYKAPALQSDPIWRHSVGIWIIQIPDWSNA